MKQGAILLLLFVGVQANAGLINFQAANNAAMYPGLATDFSILYDDTGDGLLQIAEIVSFSGVTIFGNLFPTVVGVPNIPGFASGIGGFPPGIAWEFGRIFNGGLQVVSPPTDGWLYSARPVPEANTWALLAAGLLALGFFRRKHAA